MAVITVNGVRREVQAPTDTPLLYVLRNDLELSARSSAAGSPSAGLVPFCSMARKCVPASRPFRRSSPGNHHARRAARAVGKAEGPLAEEAEKTLHPCSRPGSRSRLLCADFARTG